MKQAKQSPDEIGIEVIYRDELMIAVCKPSGMIVHRGWGNDALTVADIVRDKITGGKVYAVHRLDRGTSGVLLFALDAGTARYLQGELLEKTARKYYLALVRGPMKEPCILDHPVPKRAGGERVDAVTEFYPIASRDRWSLVLAIPYSGRLHQIRRHLKHLSHPVIGDVKYGKGPINQHFRDTYDLNRLALHAARFSFQHPDGRRVTVDAPLPDDLAAPIDRLGFTKEEYRLENLLDNSASLKVRQSH